MILNDKNSVYSECEKLGEPAVRARLAAGSFGIHTALPLQWLNEKDEERLRIREEEDRERNKRALANAEKSMAISERAASSAKDAARWAMWTVIVALIAICAQYFIR